MSLNLEQEEEEEEEILLFFEETLQRIFLPEFISYIKRIQKSQNRTL